MRLNLCESSPRRFCMKASSHVFAKVAVLSLLSVAFAISTLAGGNPDDKAILSRAAEVDGVQVHYLTAGAGAGGGGFFCWGSGKCRERAGETPHKVRTV